LLQQEKELQHKLSRKEVNPIMARVNHILVKERLNEKRSKITDRQFFTSRLLAGHFEDMAEAQTRRYKYNRRVHVNLIWEPENNLMAMTDNRVMENKQRIQNIWSLRIKLKN